LLARDDHHLFQGENRLSEATITLSKRKKRLSEATITSENLRRVMVHTTIASAARRPIFNRLSNLKRMGA
jgi:hypothetical protein